jgi:RNase H-like domain found in reverse transcriptase
MALLPPRLYFAYGSSLSISGMQSHCPTSTFYSIGLLRNHRWFVNERGCANVVPSVPGANGIEDVVWGILYALGSSDEEPLDEQEGIPCSYSKEDMDVEVISVAEDGRGTRREVMRAFELMKERVTQAPVLAHFDPEKQSFVESDSSAYVSSGILSQIGDDGLLYPMAFFSKKLAPAECNYEIYDKELLAIIRYFEQ